jgi:hypothetical protein
MVMMMNVNKSTAMPTRGRRTSPLRNPLLRVMHPTAELWKQLSDCEERCQKRRQEWQHASSNQL